jgi:hypothetical protein
VVTASTSPTSFPAAARAERAAGTGACGIRLFATRANPAPSKRTTPAPPDSSRAHLIRNAFRYASRKDWDALSKDLRPVYTAPTESAAAARFDEFIEHWGGRYPAIVKHWRSAWSEDSCLVIEGDVVTRPTGPWTPTLHAIICRCAVAQRVVPP